ncbi:MAG: hypothetical protein Q8R92_20500, partial [Deltaproteobacteria bacterium]|nr:hypothetical protein [Deltaproteobacteria bacterium]
IVTLGFLGLFYQRCLAGESRAERALFAAGTLLFAAAILAEVVGMQLRESAYYAAFLLSEESSEMLGATAFLGWAVGTRR